MLDDVAVVEHCVVRPVDPYPPAHHGFAGRCCCVCAPIRGGELSSLEGLDDLTLFGSFVHGSSFGWHFVGAAYSIEILGKFGWACSKLPG